MFRDRKYKLARIRLDALTRSELLCLFGDAISSHSKIIVLHNNLHGIYVQRAVPALDAVYDRADWVYVDGMPVVWLAQAAGFPFQATNRITLLDCFEEVVAEATRNGWRVFYFGGKEKVLTAGLERLRTLFPSLEIAGRAGHVSAEQNTNVIDEILAFSPDILFVGLGMPLQEEWIANHHSSLNIPVITTCGATMEYITGHAYRPPQWTGNLGLYGIVRLISNPKRLWKRYLVEPLVLAPYLAGAILKQRFSKSQEMS